MPMLFAIDWRFSDNRGRPWLVCVHALHSNYYVVCTWLKMLTTPPPPTHTHTHTHTHTISHDQSNTHKQQMNTPVTRPSHRKLNTLFPKTCLDVSGPMQGPNRHSSQYHGPKTTATKSKYTTSLPVILLSTSLSVRTYLSNTNKNPK